jgi:hypothetical protein
LAKTYNLNDVAENVLQAASRLVIPFDLLIFMAPFVGLMFCASPSWDDYAKAIIARPNSIGYTDVRLPHLLSAAWAEYAIPGGSGRWLTNVLQSLFMNTFGLSHAYGWLLLLVTLTNVAALAYFFRRLLGVSPKRALLAAGVLYAAWLANFVTPGQSIFWLTGAMEYQLPITSMLILAGLLCKPSHSPWSYCLLAALAIAIPAQHEIAGLFVVTCLFGGVIGARVLKAPLFPWLLTFGLAAASLAAVMLSPAMAFKLSIGHASASQGFISQLRPHAKRALEYGANWTIHPAALLAMLCLLVLLCMRNEGDSESVRPPRWGAFASVAAIFALLGEYATSEIATFASEHPPRVVGWFQFVFLVLLACAVVAGAPELSQIRFSGAARFALFALFGLSLIASDNFHQAERDLRGPARDWHRSNSARLIAKGDVIQFDPLPPRPVMFQESGLSKNTECWVNQTMAVYLGANAVLPKGPKENHWGAANLCDADPLSQ